jgi:hypothetical protein
VLLMTFEVRLTSKEVSTARNASSPMIVERIRLVRVRACVCAHSASRSS